MRRHLACAAALAIAGFAAAEARAQAAATLPLAQTPSSPKPTPAAWRAAALDHTPGEADAAVATVLSWSRADVVDAAAQGVRGAARLLLRRALLLHTDAAIAERAAFEAGSRVGATQGLQILDGRSMGGSPDARHWQIARRAAAALAARPSDAPMVRTWYHATSALLQQWSDCSALREHLEAGLELMPTDAPLLLYSATLHQTYADPRVQRFVRAATRELRIGGAKTQLQAAERDLRRAIELEPGLVEARIRLAHVLTDQGQPAEALPLTDAALATPLSPFLEYYAAMVHGRAADMLDHRDVARRTFERAAAVFPLAQSARIALSRQDLAAGRPADSMAAIVTTSGPNADRDDEDPWWSYYRVHDPEAKILLATVRAGALTP